MFTSSLKYILYGSITNKYYNEKITETFTSETFVKRRI